MWGILIKLVLQIVRQHDRRHGPFRQRDACRPINQMSHLGWRRGLRDKGAGDILEHRNELEFLLILSAARIARLLADNGEHRLVVLLRILKSGRELRGARPRRRNANTETPKE